MTKISRIPLDRQIKQRLIDELWYTLGKLNRHEVAILLKYLLSPTELFMIAKRLEIFKQLLKKNRYDDIKESIRVTDTTVAKLSTMLQISESKFVEIMKELVRDEDKRWKENINRRKPHWVGKMVHFTPK